MCHAYGWGIYCILGVVERLIQHEVKLSCYVLCECNISPIAYPHCLDLRLSGINWNASTEMHASYSSICVSLFLVCVKMLALLCYRVLVLCLYMFSFKAKVNVGTV